MSWILVAVIIIAISAIVLRNLSNKGESEELDSTDYPYQSAGVLFSPAERSFYGVLKQAVGEDTEIFGKVRVADVVKPQNGLSRSDWQIAFNKISGKHFDFLLCTKDDISIICAIELDDRSHRSEKSQKRDYFLREVCKTTELPLVQISADSSYVVDDIKQLIAPHMNIIESNIARTEIVKQASARRRKICPKCTSNMVIRTAKKGKNAGKQFWGCDSFPKCKYTEALRA